MSGTIHLIKENKSDLITNTSFYNTPNLPDKHNHIEIFFESFKIVYNDPRRFGFFEIIDEDRLFKKRFNHLGPEPFSSKFNIDYVYSKLREKQKSIKNFLIDQKFVSGIGNIYACEILFLSGIKPDKKANNLKKKDLKKILIYSKKVLYDAINTGGSSIKNFQNISGKQGKFQNKRRLAGLVPFMRHGIAWVRARTGGICTRISKRCHRALQPLARRCHKGRCGPPPCGADRPGVRAASTPRGVRAPACLERASESV